MSGSHTRGHRGDLSLVAVGIAFLLQPTSVQAHTPIKGAGEFVSGFLHPFLTPTHLLILLSLGLLLGQRLPLRLEWPLGVFALFAAIGLSMTTTHAVAGVFQPILIALGLCVGGLVALAVRLPTWVHLATCTAAGLALGLDSGADPGIKDVAVARMLLATGVSLLLCVGDIAFYSSCLPPYQWARTGIRVVGSWIVAIALLMLAFSLRR